MLTKKQLDNLYELSGTGNSSELKIAITIIDNLDINDICKCLIVKNCRYIRSFYRDLISKYFRGGIMTLYRVYHTCYNQFDVNDEDFRFLFKYTINYVFDTYDDGIKRILSSTIHHTDLDHLVQPLFPEFTKFIKSL